MPLKHHAITPQLLKRFRREERGIGTQDDYTAWYRVRRQDPSSIGRSHLPIHGDRQLDVLSDLQLAGYYCATQFRDLVDIREHFPLSLDDGPHELCAYDVTHPWRSMHGTLTLAKALHRKHPHVKDDRGSEPKPLVTSLLLTLGARVSSKRLLAVSLQSRFTGRATPSLQLQSCYWAERDVPWLLITRDQFDPSFTCTLQRVAAWGLGEPVGADALAVVGPLVRRHPDWSLTRTLLTLCGLLDCDLPTAQRAFWQAVWHGDPPLDLRRGWRPHLPLSLLTPAEWLELNPLLCGRSAWR